LIYTILLLPTYLPTMMVNSGGGDGKGERCIFPVVVRWVVDGPVPPVGWRRDLL
jgi:hypothetical protein